MGISAPQARSPIDKAFDQIERKFPSVARSSADLLARSAEMNNSVTMEYEGKLFAVDIDIAPFVRALNDAGIRTVASCSGHGYRPGRISLADGRELMVMPSYEVATWFDTQFPRDINGQTAEERK